MPLFRFEGQADSYIRRKRPGMSALERRIFDAAFLALRQSTPGAWFARPLARATADEVRWALAQRACPSTLHGADESEGALLAQSLAYALEHRFPIFEASTSPRPVWWRRALGALDLLAAPTLEVRIMYYDEPDTAHSGAMRYVFFTHVKADSGD